MSMMMGLISGRKIFYNHTTSSNKADKISSLTTTKGVKMKKLLILAIVASALFNVQARESVDGGIKMKAAISTLPLKSPNEYKDKSTIEIDSNTPKSTYKVPKK